MTFPVALTRYDATSQSYQTLPRGAPIETGVGYWAFFTERTEVPIGGALASRIEAPLGAGQWTLLANPSAASRAGMTGVDARFAWDPFTNSYVAGTVLQPGGAGWADRRTSGVVGVTIGESW